MTDGRTTPPPEDVEAERAMLGAILLGGDEIFVQVNALVRSSELTRSHHRLAYDAMERLGGRGESIDWSTVAGEMSRLVPDPAGEPYGAFLVGLMSNVPDLFHFKTYVERVRYCAGARRMIAAANEMAAIAFSGANETESELMSRAQSVFEKVLEANATGGEILNQRDLALQYTDILERRQRGDPDVVGLSTGWPDLDDYSMLKPGELWYIAGSPTAGKTSLLTNMQEDLAYRGVPSLFVSLEQPPMQLMDRAIADAARIDGSSLARGRLDERQWEAVNDALARRFDRPAYVYYRPGVTTAELAAKVQLAKVRHGVKIVFVDYVQLLGDESDESEYVRVSDISRRLMYLAGRQQVALIAACQVSRKGARVDGSPPELSDLRGSGTLEQDAFVVVALGRKPDSENIVDVVVRKNRNGPAGPLQLYFDRARTRFLSLEKSEAIPA